MGDNLIRYYGCYSNKNRGTGVFPVTLVVAQPPRLCPLLPRPVIRERGEGDARRRWAALIKRVYQADALRCPNCGGTMKIIALVEARQGAVLEKILRHCGLWEDPPYRGPPRPAEPPDPDARRTIELDPEFLEQARREDEGSQLDLAFDA